MKSVVCCILASVFGLIFLKIESTSSLSTAQRQQRDDTMRIRRNNFSSSISLACPNNDFTLICKTTIDHMITHSNECDDCAIDPYQWEAVVTPIGENNLNTEHHLTCPAVQGGMNYILMCTETWQRVSAGLSKCRCWNKTLMNRSLTPQSWITTPTQQKLTLIKMTS